MLNIEKEKEREASRDVSAKEGVRASLRERRG